MEWRVLFRVVYSSLFLFLFFEWNVIFFCAWPHAFGDLWYIIFWARRRFNRLFRGKHCGFLRSALSIERLFLSGARLPLPFLAFLLLMPLLPPSDAVRSAKIRRFYEDFFGSFTALLLGAPSMAETAFLSQFLLFLRVFGLSRGTLAGSPKPFSEEIST